MAKRKKHPIFRLHKIKIHRNRWLIWAIAYAVIVTIGLVGYLTVSGINFETQITAENNFVSWHSFSSPELGFNLHYPVSWVMEAVNKSTINLTPVEGSNQKVTLAVLKPTAETAIRNELTINKETRIQLDNYRAVQIVSDLGNGQMETVVMALRNHKLYVLRGPDALVQKLQLTFHFLPISN